MNEAKNNQNSTEQAVNYNDLLAAGDLSNGQNFLLKKGGKLYTVHCQVRSVPHDADFDRMEYTLATDGYKLHVIDCDRLVFACR